jgi:DNA polymerase-3 subunit epsilon
MIEVVLDTETTGLSVANGHRIVEIGCIELKNQIPTNKTFHCYLNPQKKVSEDALKVHGYTDEFLADKKKFSDVVEDFLKFIQNKKLVIHNAEFDISHINNELRLIGKPTILKDNVIDTLDIAREKYPGSSISLDALCKRFRIDNSRRKFHTALIDCELLSKVYINLIDQKEPKLNLQSEDTINLNISKKIDYCKRVVLPNKNELENYKTFIKKSLKKSV